MELNSELYPQGCLQLEGTSGYRMFSQTGQSGRLREQTKKSQIAENNPAALLPACRKPTLYFNGCHYLNLLMLACQNEQLHCYGNQSNDAAHLCHHKSFSLSPFVVTLIHWVSQGGGRRSGVASLLLLLKKPLVHFRKGSEQSKDSDKVNSNHDDFVLVSTREK